MKSILLVSAMLLFSLVSGNAQEIQKDHYLYKVYHTAVKYQQGDQKAKKELMKISAEIDDKEVKILLIKAIAVEMMAKNDRNIDYSSAAQTKLKVIESSWNSCDHDAIANLFHSESEIINRGQRIKGISAIRK